MIGILEVRKRGGKTLYLKEEERYGFMVVRETSRSEDLPMGYYLVRVLEFRKSKYGEYPYLSLIKVLPDPEKDFAEFVVSLSETSADTQKETVEVLHQIGFSEEEIQEIKNLLNCISVNDRREILWKIEPQEHWLLEELEINIEKLKEAYDEILRTEQEGASQDLQGGLSRGGSPDEAEKGKTHKQNSARQYSFKGFMDVPQVEL